MPYVDVSGVQFLHVVLLEGIEYLVENLGTESHYTSSAIYNYWSLMSHVADRFLGINCVSSREKHWEHRGRLSPYTLEVFRYLTPR